MQTNVHSRREKIHQKRCKNLVNRNSIKLFYSYQNVLIKISRTIIRGQGNLCNLFLLFHNKLAIQLKPQNSQILKILPSGK